jgi:benzodiazapine receptor
MIAGVMVMSGTARDALKLIAAIVVSQLAGAIGGIATSRTVNTWYTTLRKPSFNPPSWVFGPVWGTLYTLMGVAAWLVWRKGTANPVVRTALALFIVQLVLNALWSWVFFGFQQPFWGFVVILALWAAIFATMIWFFRVSAAAGVLLIPYILWVSFAGVLNFELWRLNR